MPRRCWLGRRGAYMIKRHYLRPTMLLGLNIRDIVLIDRLDLALRPGLCVLTGETGAGKSILLDALGLALGRRADASLVRPGAEQAAGAPQVVFRPPPPAPAILPATGVACGLSRPLRLPRPGRAARDSR